MRVLLGVTGCIAAYKSAELVRLLQKRDCDVFVVMTESAREFVTPLTLATLSRHRVITQMFGPEANALEPAVEHIELARSTDVFLVAPATANCLAKFAHGIADDFLSTLFLAARGPVILAPAMNVTMWQHPAVQKNLETLRSRGVEIIEPEEGYLAEGIMGKGRLANLEGIVEVVTGKTRATQDLTGENIVVTAGPTCEDIDPVRYITNRSSGKMGFQIAQAAERRGAKTVLVSGPTHLTPPSGLEFVSVRSTNEMRASVLHYLSQATIVIKAAAVADYRPQQVVSQKIKKNGKQRTLELIPTPDILAEIGRNKGSRIVVGFAAETQNAVANGRKKLKAKNLDLIVVNDVTQEGAGFGADTNIVTILRRDGKEIHTGRLSKREIAHKILDEIVALRNDNG